MPEGPEIRQSADAIGKVLENKRLLNAEVGLPALRSHRTQLIGQKVLRVTSWGKAMLIHLENALSIYSHNQLYGVWYVFPKGQPPETNRSLRLALHTDTHSAVLYSASDISIWDTQDLHQQPLLSKLGPDILSEKLDLQTIANRLTSEIFRRRKLCSLYLDQHFLAGIGNYLRSEILFFAGLHPDFRPVDLSEKHIEKLSAMSLSVTNRSYLTKGYTVDETRYNAAITSNVDYEQSRFMVFDREGLPCRVCGTPIERLNRNSRRLYVCPNCQPGS